MPPAVCVFGWICLDIFSNALSWQMRWAPQRLFDLCVRTNMGQNETSNTVASSCLLFFLLFHSLCTFFFSKLSSAGLCVSAAPHSGRVCVWVCESVCVCVYICAMRHDKRLHPPLRRRIPQRSATRSMWRPFHLSSPCFFLILLLPLCSSFPRSHRCKKGARRNERDKILIRGGGWDKSRGITKGSNDNTCKTQSLNLREHLEGSLISLPPQWGEAGGLCVWEHEGIGCDYEHRADRQRDWHVCVCGDVCVSPQGLQLPLFTGTNLKNTAIWKHAVSCTFSIVYLFGEKKCNKVPIY